MTDHPPTVLILDDDQAVRESLVDYFEDQEWRVLSAATAEEALTVLERETAHGVVVDIRLPRMDGNAFICAASEADPLLVYVIITASPGYHLPANVTALPQVSDKVFAKPVPDLAALEEALRRQIEKCREKKN